MVTRPQDTITALCAYRKGILDALSMFSDVDEGTRMVESSMIMDGIERTLRSKFHSAENGETRRIAARALSPVMSDILRECAEKAKALEKGERF